jgi:heme-degrading monooxygenase HmoA
MYARVMTVRIDQRKLDDAARVWQSLVLADHRRRRGFRRASLVADRGTGTVVITTFWDSQADSDAQARDPSRAALTAQVRLFFDAPATVKGYDVLVEGAAS